MNVLRSCARVARPCRQIVRRMSDEPLFEQKFEKSLNKIALIGKVESIPVIEEKRAVLYIDAPGDGRNKQSIRVEAVTEYGSKNVSENIKKGDTVFVDGRLEYIIEKKDNEILEKTPVVKSIRINNISLTESAESEQLEEAL